MEWEFNDKRKRVKMRSYSHLAKLSISGYHIVLAPGRMRAVIYAVSICSAGTVISHQGLLFVRCDGGVDELSSWNLIQRVSRRAALHVHHCVAVCLCVRGISAACACVILTFSVRERRR